MNFQSLPYVEPPQNMLDKAFNKAKKKADALFSSITKKTDKNLLQKKVAHEKIILVKDTIKKDLQRIIDKYPDFSGLPEFYERLIASQLDVDTVKLSLGRVQGVIDQLDKLASELQGKIRQSHDGKQSQGFVQSFYGRVSSMITRLEKPLHKIDYARQVLRTFPDIKDDCFTVALAGFPNVGKSTLLSKLTDAKPKIANYAFTTKGLNVGYIKGTYEDIQVVDTPGTLARLEKMNAIEQQAYYCLKYVADFIVFIIDPTDTYPIEEQEQLLEQVKEHDKDLVIYLSKTDIADKRIIARLKEEFSALTTIPDVLRSIEQQAKE